MKSPGRSLLESFSDISRTGIVLLRRYCCMNWRLIRSKRKATYDLILLYVDFPGTDIVNSLIDVSLDGLSYLTWLTFPITIFHT